MPQAQTPSWRWRQPAATPGEQLSQQRKQAATPGKQLLQPCHRPRCHAGSCSGTFEGGQAAVSGHYKRGRATGTDAKLDATGQDAKMEMETASGNEKNSWSQQRRRALVAAEAPCHRPRRHAGSCSGTFEGVKQQSRNTRKRGRATGSDAKFKVDATGPDAKMERETASGNARKTTGRSRGAVPQA